jgi:hypothetical protein
MFSPVQELVGITSDGTNPGEVCRWVGIMTMGSFVTSFILFVWKN